MKKSAWIVLAGAIIGMSGCNGQSDSNGADGTLPQGSDSVTQAPAPIPGGSGTGSVTLPPVSENSGVVGPSCHGGANCLALRYVVYKDSAGKPVVSQEEAIGNLQSINQTWAACGISFQMDEFLPVDPVDYGLTFNTANSSELDPIRRTFDESDTLLVVTTGKWNRSGTLGATGANAWTNMPGSSALGAILESAVGTYPNIIAHELGHYLNLPHVSDSTDLMNPVIYTTSTRLSSGQCSAALSAISYYWRAMRR